MRYRHAPMEATGLPGGCADLVAASFVVHECRPFAIRALIAEARRLLRPRGVLLLADNNPRHAPVASNTSLRQCLQDVAGMHASLQQPVYMRGVLGQAPGAVW